MARACDRARPSRHSQSTSRPTHECAASDAVAGTLLLKSCSVSLAPVDHSIGAAAEAPAMASNAATEPARPFIVSLSRMLARRRGYDIARMRLIRDIYGDAQQTKRPVISFEFFPTKTPEGERTLLEKTIPALGLLKPDFCSVTYGAGGSTRDKTLSIVDRIQREQKLT